MVQIRKKFHSLLLRTPDMGRRSDTGKVSLYKITKGPVPSTSYLCHLQSLSLSTCPAWPIPMSLFQLSWGRGVEKKWRTSISSSGSNTEVYALLLLYSIAARTLITRSLCSCKRNCITTSSTKIQVSPITKSMKWGGIPGVDGKSCRGGQRQVRACGDLLTIVRTNSKIIPANVCI